MNTGRDIIVIGASAGGVKALTKLCAVLPADLPASVFIVLHLSPTGPSLLPKLLDRVSRLKVTAASQDEIPQAGRIYVAPPARHLLLRPGRMILTRGPEEHHVRPAIDALFRSAAIAYGSRVIGMLLSGVLGDGTTGLVHIHNAGGVSIVQDPAEAQWSSMPRHALKHDHVDHCVRIERMPELLQRLLSETPAAGSPLSTEVISEDRLAEQDVADIRDRRSTRRLTVAQALPLRGRASTSIEELTSRQAGEDPVERALSLAAQTHRERRLLYQRMEDSAREKGFRLAEQRWRDAGLESERLIETLQQAIEEAIHRRALLASAQAS